MEFACLLNVRVHVHGGDCTFLSQYEDTQVRSTGDSKLPVGVNVSVNVFVYMCVSCVIDRQHVHASRPVHDGMDSSPSVTLDRISSSENRLRVGLYVSNSMHSKVCC